MKRGLDRAVLILTVISLQFFLLRIVPVYVIGIDPSAWLVEPGAPPEVQIQMQKQYGLDEPAFPHQYVRYALNLFTGQFGYSFVTRKSVLAEILDRLPNTLILDGMALTLTWMIALTMGLYAARKRGSKVDSAITITAIWSYIMPGWLMGLIMLMALAWFPAVAWGIRLFPVGGTSSPLLPKDPWIQVGDYLWHLALPVISVTVAGFGARTYFMRTMTVTELGQDYVTTARAKGVPEAKIMKRHILNCVAPPVLTSLAMSLPGIFAGGVITENIFSWYGTGRYMFQAINNFDYPAVQAMLFVTGVVTAICLYVLDIAIAYVDPRIRLR